MSVAWAQARELAAAVPVLGTVRVPLADATGLVLAADVVAVTDLPPFTVSAMDGWAVAGPPQWNVIGEVRAGDPPPAPITPGHAVRIATGAALPDGADAVLRSELGIESPAEPERQNPLLRLGNDATAPSHGRDVRQAGSECRAGDVVAAAGQLVVPALVGLAAAAGADTLDVVRRPTVDLFVLGEELLASGPPSGGRIRDALGPMLVPWLEALGGDVRRHEHLPDSAVALRSALETSTADLVVTTGSTALGPRDHLHAVLADIGGQIDADGVDVRPGHPMLLVRLADGRPMAGLPGNPLAAVSGIVTLVVPIMRALRGLAPAQPRTTTLAADVPGHPHDVRLMPVRDGRPLRFIGPAMLRGLAQAEALLVVPPGGAPAGTRVELLDLPA